jgi:hypothetical protein
MLRALKPVKAPVSWFRSSPHCRHRARSELRNQNDKTARQWGWRGWAIFVLSLGLLPLPAAAQTTEPLLPVPVAPSAPLVPLSPGQQPSVAGETVTSRLRPDYAPTGLQYGDFFFFPRGEVDEDFNSNIFALPSATSDLITSLIPSLDILSNFSSNALNLHTGAATQFYALNPTQNTTSGFVTTDGKLDVDAISDFYGSAGYNHSFIPRYSPNSPTAAAEPVTYNQYTGHVGYEETGLRLGYSADLAVQATQYNAVPAFSGAILPQSESNTVNPQATAQVSYEFIPDYRGYVRASGALYDYPRTAPGVDLNSNVYRVDFGLQIAPRHLIYGEAYVGVLAQTFHSSSLPSTTTPDFGGRMLWNVTPLTTLTFNGIRAFQTSNTTAVNTGVGYLQTVVTATVDHELRYNLLVNANASYENDNYQSITRSDNIFTASAGLRYLVNRHLFLGGSYSYQQRTTNASGAQYSQSIVTVQVGTQF